jgi:hypothetical protein
MQRTEVRSIRDVLDGHVRLVGVARPLAPAQSTAGVECLAFERRSLLPDGSLHVHAEGGTFELDDGSGAVAVVRAARVGVPEGVSAGDEVYIPPGARVEITGRARWVIADESQAWRGGLRSAARVLEIIGDDADPVVVRLVAPPEQRAPAEPVAAVAGAAPAADGVRVVVDGGAERAPRAHAGEDLDAELERLAQDELRRNPGGTR